MRLHVKLLLLAFAIPCVLLSIIPCHAQTQAQAAQAQAATAEAAQERWMAVLTSMEGSVFIRRASNAQWLPARIHDRFFPGDMVRVEAESRAALLFTNDSTMRLDQNTTITFQEMEEQTVVMRMLNGVGCFFSRIQRSLKLFTPHVNGTVKGTEFLVRVDAGETLISLYNGQMLAENDKGSVNLASGQSVLTKAGQAPVLQLVVRPRDAVQWALYYPPIMDFRPEDFTGEVRTSVEAYRQGDTAGAFKALEGVPADLASANYQIYRATLLLRVGRFDEANAAIARALKLEPQNSKAFALQTIVAVVQNQKDAALQLARRAVELDPRSASARIALSYAQQSRFDIKGALESVQEAVKLDPADAYARARLAELWLAQGYLDRALEEAKRAASINPGLARTQTVLGYAYLTQVKTAESMAAFEKAIQLDSADPLARLGLGLAKIRKGDLKGGRQEIEIAASLDINNALIRSYLGKAYYEEKRETLSADQFAVAKELDPMDPTAYFYDAILKQSVNRPVEAMQDIQKSIELNDNRAVYRSKLLLDQDLAARSASLGQIFNNLGFQQVALVEGWKSVNTDPANFSAHRFLADSYASQPRQQTARVSELLQSQLLQPININPVSPVFGEGNLRMFAGSGPTALSFNEFNPLFNRNSVALQASGALGSQNTAGDEVALSGVYDRFSMSLGQFYYKTDGFRTNNDQNKEIYNAFTQWMITPQTSVQAEVRYTDYKYGDLALRFNPSETYSDRFTDRSTSARLGLRHAFTPNSDFIASFVYSHNDFSVKAFEGIYSSSDSIDAYQVEAQYLYRADRFRLIVGGGWVNSDDEEPTTWTFPGMDPIENQAHLDVHHTNFYAYTLTTFPKSVTWTLGLSVDLYGATNELGSNQVNPKFGVTWTPWDSTTFRAAAFRTLKKSLINRQTIEPTQVAGFNQFFDDTNGADAWNYGVAVDQKIFKNLFAGVALSKRDLSNPYQDFAGGFTFATHEELAQAYVYWTPFNWLAVSAEYEYVRWDLDPPYGVGEENVTKIKTNRFPLAINVFSETGLFGQLKATYVDHEADNFTTDPITLESYSIPGSSTFWVWDASIGYRLPKRYGIITLEAKNLFNQSFRFVDTDRFMPRIYPDRFILGRITLSF